MKNKAVLIGGGAAFASVLVFLGWRLMERVKYKEHLLSAYAVAPTDDDATAAAKQTALATVQPAIAESIARSIPWFSLVTASQVIAATRVSTEKNRAKTA